MSPYSLALFFHIVGALGLFAALALEWTGLVHLRRAETAAQFREWMKILNLLPKVGAPSVLVILVTGIYLTAQAWQQAGWVPPALGALVLIALIGATLTGPRIRAMQKALPPNTTVSISVLQSSLHSLRLWLSLQLRSALALGVVFLMTAKPDTQEALIFLSIWIVAGMVIALIARVHLQKIASVNI